LKRDFYEGGGGRAGHASGDKEKTPGAKNKTENPGAIP